MGIMPEKQNGLSLVELLIALAISSFLILGTAQLFIDSKRNYAFNQGQSGSMENGRFVLMVLEQQLSKTGYRAKPWEARENAFPALASTNSCPAFAAGETFLLSADKQSICFRYQGSGDVSDRDCLGNTVAAGGDVLTRISYVASKTPGEGSLTCSAQGKPAQTLISGLASFVFSTTPSNSSDSLVVRYAALLASPENLRNGIGSDALERWKTLSDETLEDDGKHVYQMVQNGITLRNLMK